MLVRVDDRGVQEGGILQPGEGVALRPALEQWFEKSGIRPHIVGEFDDSALLKAFGQSGAGLFAAPTAISSHVCKQYDVCTIGQADSVLEELYAITTDRRMSHPAMVAIRQAAAHQIFGKTPS
ncbi:MAG: hypothetical protein HC848_03735 [Limnobacter sp.]|nr:hypothetical protein [Limnobacter sp.]